MQRLCGRWTRGGVPVRGAAGGSYCWQQQQCTTLHKLHSPSLPQPCTPTCLQADSARLRKQASLQPSEPQLHIPRLACSPERASFRSAAVAANRPRCSSASNTACSKRGESHTIDQVGGIGRPPQLHICTAAQLQAQLLLLLPTTIRAHTAARPAPNAPSCTCRRPMAVQPVTSSAAAASASRMSFTASAQAATSASRGCGGSYGEGGSSGAAPSDRRRRCCEAGESAGLSRSAADQASASPPEPSACMSCSPEASPAAAAAASASAAACCIMAGCSASSTSCTLPTKRDSVLHWQAGRQGGGRAEGCGRG